MELCNVKIPIEAGFLLREEMRSLLHDIKHDVLCEAHKVMPKATVEVNEEKRLLSSKFTFYARSIPEHLGQRLKTYFTKLVEMRN